ncbi:hypothetical protein ABZ208_14035 [Streptomyces sp. NPDC006208]|uniref:hypothetical protein n=1 Tax=Streptomyces sp. NPDC006208 TaxID=3156734 RepID=UPI0033A79429
MAEPLTPEREQEIRETHPGEWYGGEWTQDYVESDGSEPAYCRVVHHESGTTLATLPDFAGPIALFIADAHDAVPELLAEIDRLRQQRKYLIDQLAKKDARSGDGDRALREFLNPDTAASSDGAAGDQQPETGAGCQCRTDRDGDGNGWIRYQARDREFVELRCRDHKGGAS